MDRGDWRGMVHGGRKTVLHDLATKIYFYISDYLYGIDLWILRAKSNDLNLLNIVVHLAKNYL